MLNFLEATHSESPKPALLSGTLQGNCGIFPLIGELDESHLEWLNQSVEPLLKNPQVQKLILDCRQLIYINSKIVGFLVGLHTHLSKEARHLIIAAPPQAVMDVIQLVGLTSIILVVNTMEEALAA